MKDILFYHWHDWAEQVSLDWKKAKQFLTATPVEVSSSYICMYFVAVNYHQHLIQ